MVEVGIAQFGPGQDKRENLRAVRTLARQAADRGARVVVAPEYSMFTAPRVDERIVAAAEPLDGEFVTGLTEIAADLNIHLVAGIAEQLSTDNRISNTLVAVSPADDLVAVYRKLHLYDAFGFRESDVIRPGPIEEPETFTVDGLSFGMQTCYDVRFPETTRRIVDAGATVLALPAQWIPGPLKEDHWTTLVRARAIENTVYVLAADQCGRGGAGNSMIVDPMGVVSASLGESIGVATAELSADRVNSVRETNPALELRRFGVTDRG